MMRTENGYIAVDSTMIASLAPLRPEDGHKGTFGTVLINAGSPYMTGALCLAVSSALRSGAGLVRAYAPEEALVPVRTLCPCALQSAEPSDPADAVRLAGKLLKTADAVAAGPGMDTDDKRNLPLILYYIQNAGRLVLDAGALGILSECQEDWRALLRNRLENGLLPAVLTPHVGEARRLLGKSASDIDLDDLEGLCVQFARENKCIMVLKNHKTLISSYDGKCYINCVGNNGMAKGGSGDVLTGLLAGLLAQGVDPTDAAISAVHIHATAGDLAREDRGARAMLPTDIIGNLSEAYRRLGW